MNDSSRDLRKLSSNILRELASVDEAFKTSDADRVESASNVLLVLTRVLAQAAVRSGVSKDRVAQLAKDAERPTVPVHASIEEVEVEIETGRHDVFSVMTKVDRCLACPSKAALAPDWFKGGWYPNIIRNVAAGNRASSRDVDIMLAIVSLMEGER